MATTSNMVRTEVYGLELGLHGSSLVFLTSGKMLMTPVALDPDDAERLRLEIAKAHLAEWNQMEQAKVRAERRYRTYLGSWLVLCLAAFSAYVGYPDYYLPVLLLLLSLFLWWRAGRVEREAERAAQEARKNFVPNWSYLQQRLEEPTAE